MAERKWRPIPALPLLLALACAKPSSPSSPLEPTLGRSQPVPTTTSAEPHQPTLGDDGPRAKEPPSEAPPSEAPLAPVTEIEEQLCRHIIAVVRSESESPLTREQLDELHLSCSLALAMDRRRLGESEFQRRADCVRATQSVAGFSACGENDGR